MPTMDRMLAKLVDTRSPSALLPNDQPGGRTAVERARWFVFQHFEALLVVLLVASMLAIHDYVDYELGFLSFYYLPVIVAGFHLGRRGGVWSAVLIVALVTFLQTASGVDGLAGLHLGLFATLVPWGGFLIITGYAVGTLADQRSARVQELSATYLSLLELLTFHLESSERYAAGHSYRVAERALALGRELGMREDDLQNLRVAALLHELGPTDPRLLRLLEEFPGGVKALPVATSMRDGLDLVREFSHYHEHLGAEWPVDMVRVSLGVKVLAVADAYETLLLPSPNRPPFSPWAAVEEIERGTGQFFGTEVVRALRKLATSPERSAVSASVASLPDYRERAAAAK